MGVVAPSRYRMPDSACVAQHPAGFAHAWGHRQLERGSVGGGHEKGLRAEQAARIRVGQAVAEATPVTSFQTPHRSAMPLSTHCRTSGAGPDGESVRRSPPCTEQNRWACPAE